MTDKKKLSNEIEEQIQSLAGDIYIQVEDKISAFLSKQAEQSAVSEESIKEHTLYKILSKTSQETTDKLAKLEKSAEILKEETKKEILNLKSSLSEKEKELKTFNELNKTKSTDTEKALKEKLSVIENLKESVELSLIHI